MASMAHSGPENHGAIRADRAAELDSVSVGVDDSRAKRVLNVRKGLIVNFDSLSAKIFFSRLARRNHHSRAEGRRATLPSIPQYAHMYPQQIPHTRSPVARSAPNSSPAAGCSSFKLARSTSYQHAAPIVVELRAGASTRSLRPCFERALTPLGLDVAPVSAPCGAAAVSRSHGLARRRLISRCRNGHFCAVERFSRASTWAQAKTASVAKIAELALQVLSKFWLMSGRLAQL
jgi:hypothetical protein